ncbi:carboxylesterase family protein [Porticoccaceae bacterium]|nr:carboxylesterase family protein [Porticoccaceae bacterium]
MNKAKTSPNKKSKPMDVAANTLQGTFLGELVPNTEGVELSTIAGFKGIPYALPPVGVRRWQPAEPFPDRKGEYMAKAFSPSPIQPVNLDTRSFLYQPGLQTSEDCLYLNIWTPADFNSIDQIYPVMVWFYGGGLLVGSTSMPDYDGAELAKKGVVVVTVNYRLGVFGYFSHPALSAESPQGASGNYGTTDQIQALKWVRQNISAFGGDATNVTIFGESAGALSVSHLMASPLSGGLFHKAIMQSAYLPPMPGLKDHRFGFPPAEDQGLALTGKLGLAEDKNTLQSLRDLPADQILQASADLEFDKTVVDNWVFTAQIFEIFEQGKQHDVPLLAGFNHDEGSYFSLLGLVQEPEDKKTYVSSIQAKYGELAEKYLEVYPADDLYRAAWAPMGDGLYAWATEYLVQLMETVSSDAYLYCFNHVPVWAKAMKAWAAHGMDVPYCFNTVKHHFNYPPKKSHKPTDSDLSMAEVISDYWVAFASQGKPEVENLADWNPYKETDQHYMLFQSGYAHPHRNRHPAVFQLHKDIVNQRRKNQSHWTYQDIGLLAPDKDIQA